MTGKIAAISGGITEDYEGYNGKCPSRLSAGKASIKTENVRQAIVRIDGIYKTEIDRRQTYRIPITENFRQRISLLLL